MLYTASSGRRASSTTIHGNALHTCAVTPARVTLPIAARVALSDSYALPLAAHDNFAPRTASLERVRSRVLIGFARPLRRRWLDRGTPSTLPVDCDCGVRAAARVVARVQHVWRVSGPMAVAQVFGISLHACGTAIATGAGGAGLAPAGIDHPRRALTVAERPCAVPTTAVLRLGWRWGQDGQEQSERRRQRPPLHTRAQKTPELNEPFVHGIDSISASRRRADAWSPHSPAYPN